MPLYGGSLPPNVSICQARREAPSSLAASPDGPWSFTYQPWRVARDCLNLDGCECGRSSIAYEHDCERREALIAHKLLAVANTRARCVAPIFWRSSVAPPAPLGLKKARGANHCWMKIIGSHSYLAKFGATVSSDAFKLVANEVPICSVRPRSANRQTAADGPANARSLQLLAYMAVTLSHQGRRSCVCSQLSDCSDDNCRPSVHCHRVLGATPLLFHSREHNLGLAVRLAAVQAWKRPGGLIQ